MDGDLFRVVARRMLIMVVVSTRGNRVDVGQSREMWGG